MVNLVFKQSNIDFVTDLYFIEWNETGKKYFIIIIYTHIICFLLTKSKLLTKYEDVQVQ